MKKIIILSLLMLTVGVVFSQQLPHFSQYYLNDYLINPAVAGSRPYFEGKSAHRYQWEGITDAPRTYTLSVNGPTKNQKMGLGGYVFTDNVGPTRRTGANLSYAYHVKVSDKLKLGMGISAGVIQFMIDGSKITLRESDDDIITNGVQSVLLPDAGFGLYLYHEKYYVGFSAPQLLNSRVTFFKDGRNPEGTLPSHFFFNGGYKFKLAEDFVLEPSVFVKYISPVPVQFEGTLRLIYQDKVWLSGTYRDKDAITASIGYLINNYFTVAYGFDFTTTNLRNYSNGTHELMVGVRFYQYANKKSAPSIN
ncbi:MAG: type IX secretion system membrane protein PorP/SprF [Flavobacteriales bacterium]|nr:type IX secretion system membrane protein PorP/SprF [Flavobacteriales bacterium]MBX2960672.1 type IX secretion system membrane protein PorP/SprF [Flavobacteriales bacterium]MCL4856296.1 type IX secretion system membrane protein PorP/SprF [Flavobacteriales bacterium]